MPDRVVTGFFLLEEVDLLDWLWREVLPTQGKGVKERNRELVDLSSVEGLGRWG